MSHVEIILCWGNLNVKQLDVRVRQPYLLHLVLLSGQSPHLKVVTGQWSHLKAVTPLLLCSVFSQSFVTAEDQTVNEK